MSSQTDPIVRIQELVRARHYRIGLHAVRHMVEEGSMKISSWRQ